MTTNLGDFPEAELSKYNIVAIHQDDFVLDQIGLTAGSARIVATAIVAHKKSLRKSRTNWKQYFEVMEKPAVGLQKTFAEVSSGSFRSLTRFGTKEVFRRNQFKVSFQNLLGLPQA